MTRTLPVLIVAALALACGSMSTSTTPTPTTPTSVTAPTGSTSLALGGTWTGTGTDPQGDEQLTITVSQTGATLSGSADMKAKNAADGSCASCHKLKSGTFTGSLVGTVLSMKLIFPSGGDGVPTPMCTISFDASAAGVTNDRITATYSGDDSCEGSFSGGTFTLSRF